VLNGVDVASFQGAPGAWAPLAGTIEFAAVKITELDPPGGAAGEYLNPDAAADWAYLKAHGKVRLAYMYARPSVSAAASASWFIRQLNKLGVEDGDGIALDLEVTDNLAPGAVASWARSVMATLRSEYGRIPLLYTFIDFAREGNCAGLGGYPLWISDPSSPAGHPVVPAPWSTWTIHQYSTEAGKIDKDLAVYATPAAMTAALGKIPPPPPSPVKRKEIEMILVQVDQATVPSGVAWPGVFLLASNGSLLHVTPPEGAVNNVTSYQAAGIPGPVNISYNEYLARVGTAGAAPTVPESAA
jgi:lysozyme